MTKSVFSKPQKDARSRSNGPAGDGAGAPASTYRTTIGWTLTEADMEKGGGPSMTIPDQGISVRDLLANYTRHSDVRYREGVYTMPDETGEDYDADDLEKIPQMDYADRQELIELNRARIEDAQRQLDLLKQMGEADSAKRDVTDPKAKATNPGNAPGTEPKAVDPDGRPGAS